VTLYSPDTWLNKRVNAVNVYRAEGLTTDDRPSSFYRLVGTIDLTSPWANATQTGWTATAYSANLLDTGTYGPAYEANSGLPETLQDSNVNYAVSASYGGYHFVGNCYHSYWEDASRTIFRSQPNAFSSFNALSSYVVLPIIPTALAAWNGYLYAFDETSIYRINVNTLGVEDKLNGYGALNQDGVLVRPEGIYFADAQNIYLYNGNIQRIGDPIATSGSSFQAGHQAYITAGYNVSLLSYERKSSLACLYTRSGGTPDILLFHFKTNSWHYWHIENSNTNDAGQYSGTTSGAKGGFTDKAGDLFIGMGIDGTYDGILKVSGRTNAYHAGYWYTPDFPLDDHSQNKKFYGCTVLGTVGSTTLTYDVNLTGSYGASPGLKTFFKSMSVLIFLNSTTTLQRVKTFSLMFRRMIGKR